MSIDPLLTIASFGIGMVVGLTGMGGGALMTPVLVLFFGVPPLTAVSSDLVASAVMKPVGSGSLIIIALMALYPSLKASELVGTDLVQAVPLVASAALGHILFGDFKLDLTTSLLLGCIPGVWVGAHMSARAPGGLVRRALAFVLLASALKLLHVSNTHTGIILILVALLAPLLWMLVRRRHGFPALRPSAAKAKSPAPPAST